ncbi:MAG TPA: hypothetical protein VGH49_09585 [Xanthobacteraceae bacterium]
MNDVLHGERIVDTPHAVVASRRHQSFTASFTPFSVASTSASIGRIHGGRDRSNFNQIRGEFAASLHQSRAARRTAFSRVVCRVAIGE